MTKQNYLLSIIIVNFNAGQILLECVRSLLENHFLDIEVLLVDNASKDNSIDLVKKVYGTDRRLQFIFNDANRGFSAANNQGLAQAQGNYLLFLNPDCVIKPNTLVGMVKVMDANLDAGMAGCLIRNEDGSVQATCVRNIPTPWNSLVRVLHLHKLFPHWQSLQGLDLGKNSLPATVKSVQGISGAFMFVRRSALEKVGLLDEQYFLYCEDADWMLRFQQAGYKILFVPDVEIMHVKSVSSRQMPFRVLWYKCRGMMRFYNKFFRMQYPLFLMWLVYLGIWLRFILLTFITVINIYGKNTFRWRGWRTDK